MDKKWWFVLGLWVVSCIVVIVLWTTGVLTTTVVEQAPSTSCSPCAAANISEPREPVDWEERIKRAIVQVPTYNPLTLPRENMLEKEQDVISTLPDTEPVLTPSNSITSEHAHYPNLEHFIEYVIFINNGSPHPELEAQVDALGLNIKRSRLSAIKQAHNQQARLMSHVTCLAKAAASQKNIMILEHQFEFRLKPAEFDQVLDAVTEVCGPRWDVIYLAQNVQQWQFLGEANGIKVCKVEQNSGISGYLVNKLYINRLVLYCFQKLRECMKAGETDLNISEILSDLQTRDVWLAFNLGIGHAGVDDQWRPVNSLTHQTHAVTGQVRNIALSAPTPRYRVAVCHVATGDYNDYVHDIQRDCFMQFLKTHYLEFFLFTDRPDVYTDETLEGLPCHVYHIDRESARYRFHYLLMAEAKLTHFDYIYTMDVDYRVYQHPPETDLLRPGVVATQDIASLVPSVTKYAPHFHGGRTPEYLKMCHSIKGHVEEHTEGDETSDLNQYLALHPPVWSLPQSYIFSERCLNEACTEPVCKQLRSQGNVPIMGPVQ